MPLRQCALVRHGDRVGVYPSARVARSAEQTGTWVPHEPRRRCFLVMRRTAGGFGVAPELHFDLPLDAGDEAIGAAVLRQLAGA